jgi:hypothetical protein
LKGSTTKNFLDAIQRFLKQYEIFYQLTEIYDTANWTWSSHFAYKTVVETLKSTTKMFEAPKGLKAAHGSNFADFISLPDFMKVHDHTLAKAQQLLHQNFPAHLSIMQHWWLQRLAVFISPRGGEELELLSHKEITVVDDHVLVYSPCQFLKNVTLDGHYNLRMKGEMRVEGKIMVDFYLTMLYKKQQDWWGSDRVLQFPARNATTYSQFFFEKRVRGHEFVREMFSKYCKEVQQIDPNFPKGHFTNGSLRKLHVTILNCSNLPASVQQHSLGHAGAGNQNWKKHYLDPNENKVQQAVSSTIANLIDTPLQDITNCPGPASNHLLLSTPKKIKHETTSSLTFIAETSHGQQTFKFEVPLGSQIQLHLPAGIQFTFSL